MHTLIGRLDGVTLLHDPGSLVSDILPQFSPDSDTRGRIIAYTEAETRTAVLAQSLGATVICVADGETPPTGPDTYWQSRSYGDAYTETDQFMRLYGHSIDAIPRIYLSDLSDEALCAPNYLQNLGGRCVLAYSALDNGHIKYLLDEPGQWEILGRFLRETNIELDRSRFEVRPFVSTPSDRYTSFRVITDATGGVLAAGMYYSAHTKTAEPRRVVEDRFTDSRPDTVVRSIKKALEERDSPYFLDGIDVRSNSACGGSPIALMGENRKPLSPLEADILRAHDIDPQNPEPPTRLVETAKYIAETLGPDVHLLTATDFVDTQCCEVNFGPSGGVYAACHMAGEGTRIERYMAMRRHALANLSRKHNSAKS